jgi:hypothetical protein
MREFSEIKVIVICIPRVISVLLLYHNNIHRKVIVTLQIVDRTNIMIDSPGLVIVNLGQTASLAIFRTEQKTINNLSH